MKTNKYIYIITLLFIFFSNSIIGQIVKSGKLVTNDEFLIIDNFNDIYGLKTTNNTGPEIANFSFFWTNSFSVAIANVALLNIAMDREKRVWFNEQKNLIKENIENKLNKTFANYDEAKNGLFLYSEQGNISRNAISPKNKYNNLSSSGYSRSKSYLEDLKLLQFRRAEISAGNINNSQYGYIDVNGVALKDLKDLNTINLIWGNITGSLGDNIWRTHEYKYTYEKLNNLGSSFNQEVVNLKNDFYKSFNEWDQLNLMQLLLNYERYKELSSCYVCLIPDSFYKFRALDKATPEVIENYAIKNKGGGMSIFHPDYPSSIASDYLYLFVGVWEGQYEALDYAEREVEKLREDVINNLLNTTSSVDFAITNLISELKIQNSSQKNWLYGHSDEADKIINFLNANRINGNVNVEVVALIINTINLKMSYTSTNYPGINDGLPYKWWLDNNIIDNNPFFNQDPYDVWKSITQKERDLITSFPRDAWIIYKNRSIAENATKIKFGINGLNDKSDAFRHAYYNAINTKKVGAFMAELFSTAHESETPLVLILEKEMDLFNNHVGHLSEINYPQLSITELINQIYQDMLDGKLRYLSPLDWLISPRYDINGDKIQDCSSCKNGIISTTFLTPTNQ